MTAFVGGGAFSTAAVAVLEPGNTRSYAIVLGVLITVLGCVLGLLTTRRQADQHDEEVDVLRNELHVYKLDGRERQVRIEELERELSAHSRALARLLGH